MRPLTDINDFLKRFDNFKDAEFRSLEVISATKIQAIFAGQDSARDFDWVSMKLEFNGVSDAKLSENSKLSLVDMSYGINIIFNNDKFAFCLGECYNMSNIKNSICFIIADNIKYEEGLF